MTYRPIPRIVRGRNGVGAGVPFTQAIRNANEDLKIARPDLNDTARQVVLAIVLAESGFGTIDMKHGFLNDDGSPSHNWGARKGPGDAGCIMHGDADESGEVCFSRYSSGVAGAKGFFKTRAWGSEPYASHAIKAAKAGDAYRVAEVMKEGGYYTGFGCNGRVLCIKGTSKPKGCAPYNDANVKCAIIAYAKGIDSRAGQVAKALGQPKLVHLDIPSGTVGKVILLGGIAAAAGYGWYQYLGGRDVVSRYVG